MIHHDNRTPQSIVIAEPCVYANFVADQPLTAPAPGRLLSGTRVQHGEEHLHPDITSLTRLSPPSFSSFALADSRVGRPAIVTFSTFPRKSLLAYRFSDRSHHRRDSSLDHRFLLWSSIKCGKVGAPPDRILYKGLPHSAVPRGALERPYPLV
ncbi:hypothetical protein VTN00DRAFT_5724 [Thermoascus crustaceus]|uniref:uncharacterized protein n=1 Tax=Thermoascus crustaceus TaxID=5088 RepID=UPI00374229C1